MLVRNTTIILLLVFCAIYGWFNFDFVSYEFASILGIDNDPPVDDSENIVSADEIFLFPIGSEKKGNESQPAQEQIAVASTLDDYALRELESTDGPSIVLMTCWPTGTNAKRVAVRADLI